MATVFVYAETEGFEPSEGFNPLNTLAPCRFRPLSHVSNLLLSQHSFNQKTVGDVSAWAFFCLPVECSYSRIQPTSPNPYYFTLFSRKFQC